MSSLVQMQQYEAHMPPPPMPVDGHDATPMSTPVQYGSGPPSGVPSKNAHPVAASDPPAGIDNAQKCISLADSSVKKWNKRTYCGFPCCCFPFGSQSLDLRRDRIDIHHEIGCLCLPTKCKANIQSQADLRDVTSVSIASQGFSCWIITFCLIMFIINFILFFADQKCTLDQYRNSTSYYDSYYYVERCEYRAIHMIDAILVPGLILGYYGAKFWFCQSYSVKIGVKGAPRNIFGGTDFELNLREMDNSEEIAVAVRGQRDYARAYKHN